MKKPVAVLIVLLTVVLFAACTVDSIPFDPTRPVSTATPEETAVPSPLPTRSPTIPAPTTAPDVETVASTPAHVGRAFII